MRVFDFFADKQQYCILFVGVHLMQACIQQEKWQTAFDILRSMISRKVLIHRMTSVAVSDTESIQMALRV